MAKAQSKTEPDEPTATAVAEPEAENVGAEQPERAQRKPKKEPSFFQRVAAIDTADWGTRAKIRVYRLEPIIDKLRGSENKYIMVYAEPVDEERIKIDHGSGRYRLYLNFKSAGKKEETEIDSTEFDISDPNYPPNVALTEWVEDPKNKKWAWAKAAIEKREASQKRDPQASGIDSAEKVLDMMERLEERIARRYETASAETPAKTSDLKDLVQAAKDIAELKQPTAAVAPQSSAADDQIKAMREDLKFYREKLFESMGKDRPNGFSTFKEVLTELRTFLPEVKGLLPGAEALTVGGRSRMTGDQEFWQGLATTAIDKLSPLVNNFGSFMMARAMAAKAAQPPTASGAPGVILPPPGLPAGMPPAAASVPSQPPAAPSEPQSEMAGMLQLLNESLAIALAEGRDGSEYADHFEGLFGQQAYDRISAVGKDQILAIVQSLPVYAHLGILQSKVPQFVEQFLAYGIEDADVGEEKKEGV